jgi:hypothetical protein
MSVTVSVSGEGGEGEQHIVSLGEVREIVELLENLQESVDKYYDWASLLHEEFREIKRRVGAIEDALMEEEATDREGEEEEEEEDIVSRLAQLRSQK